MRTLYLKPRLARALPRDCCVVNVSPLLKELILHACSFASLKKSIPCAASLDRQQSLTSSEPFRWFLCSFLILSDPRALRIAEILIADPSDRRPLAQICKVAGAGKRTVERLFQEDVGMTIGKWRQQLRSDAGNAPLGGGSQGHARRFGSGLQYVECVHFHVQKNARDYAHVVLSNGGEEQCRDARDCTAEGGCPHVS